MGVSLMLENETWNTVTVRTPSTEYAYILMTAAQCLNCTIQKYYWSSKFDHDIIEDIEPVIIDAYDCVVILKGNKEDLIKAIDVYKFKAVQRKGLPSGCVKLSEEDIQKYAIAMLNSL